MTLKKRYIQVADKKDYFLSCNFKWESQARQSLHLRTFLFGSVTACEKSTTVTHRLDSCDHLLYRLVTRYDLVSLLCRDLLCHVTYYHMSTDYDSWLRCFGTDYGRTTYCSTYLLRSTALQL